MDTQALHDLVASRCRNICAIMAARNGDVVYQDAWNDFTVDDALHVMSVTKSVASLLVGIAVDRGLIHGVGQRVLDFFPEYTPKRGEKTLQEVTLRHLLTMTAPYKYRSEPWSKICSSDDWTLAALDFLGGRSGLTDTFLYATLGVHILTGVLAKVSGMPTVDFANRVLFAPLGIAPRKAHVAPDAEAHKAFMLCKRPMESLWFCDPQGVCAAGYGLCLSAREMLVIGQMCLNGGMVGGQQVVSRAWLEESTRPRIKTGEQFGNMEYGYLWWTPDSHSNAYAALGNSGNVIYIDPERGVTVSVLSSFKPNVFDRVQFIQQCVLPLCGADA